MLLGQTVQAGERCTPWVAKAYSVTGRVEALLSGESTWRGVKAEDVFCRGDQIRTMEDSRAALELSNETPLRIDQHTTLSITGPAEEPASVLALIRGALHLITRTPRSLKVNTPYASAYVDGTEFLVRVEADRSLVVVYEGRVLAENRHGQLHLTSGEAALAEKDKAPRRYLLAQPRDAVAWALYYPPILEPKAREFPPLPEVQRSIALYRDGKPAEALALIRSLPPEPRAPRVLLFRAGLYLYVGRVEEARRDIQEVLALEPRNGDAYALQAIMEVARNNKEEALRLAGQAVALDPESPNARLARSYAEQAHFRLKEARRSIKEALALNRDHALLWARLAELEMSEGNLEEAEKAAEEAVRLNPRLSRTQTVLGFAHLTRIRTGAAKQSFEEAIRLDPTDPLPHLGLGLARIREGELEAGREEIELATSLDPGDALIRSYMGKAYYEEKRDPLAASQFDLAKALDPNDPTPFFYDAIMKQTENRPVEALRDLQKAIELNDNRAVYRSKLLLDSDLAARSASLGRIYRDLGFEQLALVEGWKSVNTDPADYSGHRLLADSYSTLPQHGIARVSELLQSQLRQPINITPVQPQLAERDLLILEGAGPASPAFNEFNPLFTRNRLAFQESIVVGGNNTFGDEVVHSGLWKNLSYSLGQFHYETDGFRENNDLTEDIYNVFVQGALSPKLSFQAEARHREIEHGDLRFRFYLDQPITEFRRNVRTDSMRVGAHYTPAPHSDFVVSVNYQDTKSEQDFFGSPVNDDNHGYIAEAQYLFRIPLFKLLVGGSRYHIDTESIIDFNPFESEIQHSNAYFYSYFHYAKKLTWTVGVGFDALDNDVPDVLNLETVTRKFDRINPKFGMIWDITPRTTLRLGAFRTLKRTILFDQTIEPTQVAGFNQFFDDPTGTETRGYGIALDQRFSSKLYAGLEISKRDLIVPRGTTEFEDWEEELYRVYLDWTPHTRFAVSLGYQLEQFDNETDFQPPDTATHLAPVTLRYFHPSGFFSSLGTTYVSQKVTFQDDAPDDQFVLLDASVGYRLPMRLGIFSINVRNLLDEDFSLHGVGGSRTPRQEESPLFLPERTVFAQFTLAF